MKNATGTVIIFFVLIECRANFTDPFCRVSNNKKPENLCRIDFGYIQICLLKKCFALLHDFYILKRCGSVCVL